jgi:lysophospholipase L1-like esterase
MDFYAMSDAERRRWLDDGLHLTEMGYDVLGRHIARAIERLAAGLKSD